MVVIIIEKMMMMLQRRRRGRHGVIIGNILESQWRRSNWSVGGGSGGVTVRYRATVIVVTENQGRGRVEHGIIVVITITEEVIIVSGQRRRSIRGVVVVAERIRRGRMIVEMRGEMRRNAAETKRFKLRR